MLFYSITGGWEGVGFFFSSCPCSAEIHCDVSYLSHCTKPDDNLHIFIIILITQWCIMHIVLTWWFILNQFGFFLRYQKWNKYCISDLHFVSCSSEQSGSHTSFLAFIPLLLLSPGSAVFIKSLFWAFNTEELGKIIGVLNNTHSGRVVIDE